MSGFAAVFNFDVAPVDAEWLGDVEQILRPRGPDRSGRWSDGSCGLVHSLLQVADEDAFDRQPLTLDQRVWIVADARVDARVEILHALRQAGDEIPDASRIPDSEIILRAYLQWGEACLDRLIGDFAFVIWDSRRRSIFAAHDHFGVVPLFFAHTSSSLIISNTIDAVRRHPSVSDEWNELAIGDFLCLGTNYDPWGTFYREIQRLPASHCLTLRDRRLQTRRYWRHEEPDDVEPAEPEEAYVERFRTALDQAVRDRLRGGGFGTHLSGGLDSTSVAATAQYLLRSDGRSARLRAYTNCVSRFVEERDFPFTQMVARHIDVPLRRFNIEDSMWVRPRRRSPEPYQDPAGSQDEMLLDCAQDGRVLLTGYGGDPLFCPHSHRLRRMFLRGKWLRMLQEIRERKRRGLGLAGFGLRSAIYARRSRKCAAQLAGRYLASDFAASYRPAERLQEAWSRELRLEAHPGMAEAMLWAGLFAQYDPGQTGRPVKARHPFFDMRVLHAVSRSPVTSLWRKALLRGAMQGRLPEPVRSRRKVPFGSDWQHQLCREIDREGLPSPVQEALRSGLLISYLKLPTSPGRIPADPQEQGHWMTMLFRALDMANWLGQTS